MEVKRKPQLVHSKDGANSPEPRRKLQRHEDNFHSREASLRARPKSLLTKNIICTLWFFRGMLAIVDRATRSITTDYTFIHDINWLVYSRNAQSEFIWLIILPLTRIQSCVVLENQQN